MASISRDKSGTVRILFVDRAGERRSVRPGKLKPAALRTFKVNVELLNQARITNTAIDSSLAEWVAGVSPVIHKRLERVGLVDARLASAPVTLGELFTAFFAGVAVKPATLVRMKQAESSLLAHFTKDRTVPTITQGDADAWRAKLTEQGYASATISRTVLYARQLFRWAIRRGMAKHNPFAELKAGSQINTARQVFIDRETIAKVIDAAPDAEWRLLIALSRFGGLRVPSEALALKWTDVDWEHNRLTVRSPKTEHHEGKGERIIPLFPEIREHLQSVFDAAPVGAVYVIGRYREGANLNPHFRRIIGRAGLPVWERTWHNLRASRQTELASSYPLHTVCAWIGNTKAIAAGHYLQVTDADWTRATAAPQGGAESDARIAQNQAQQGSADDRTGSPESSKSPSFAGVARVGANNSDLQRNEPMGRAGLEPATPAFSMRCSTN